MTTTTSIGRGYFWAGIGVGLLALGLVAGQWALKRLFVPWYVPALTTFGVLLLIASVAQRRSIIRITALVLVTLLAGFEWFFLISLSKLPSYEGPARVGQQIPAFQTTLADGRAFGDKDLKDGTRTIVELADGTKSVLVFFRGRW